jgi:hypothetical protein
MRSHLGEEETHLGHPLGPARWRSVEHQQLRLRQQHSRHPGALHHAQGVPAEPVATA